MVNQADARRKSPAGASGITRAHNGHVGHNSAITPATSINSTAGHVSHDSILPASRRIPAS